MNHEVERGRAKLLLGELRWFMSLRWAAGLVIIAAGLAQCLWMNDTETGVRTGLLGVAILIYNAVFRAVLRSHTARPPVFDRLVRFASVQVHVDIGAITLLTVWSGGLSSPFLGAYFVHMLFASLLQPRARAYAIAAISALALSVGLWSSRQWPVDAHSGFVGLGWLVVMFVTVYLTDRVTRSLYRRELVRVRQLHRIRAMSARLRHQQDSLVQSEKMAAMGQLAAGVAHEIANPLAGMDGLLQLMQRHPDKPRPDGVPVLREQIQRILRIVRQLTAYAHPGSGVNEPMNVNDVVQSALDMFLLSKRAHRVALETSLTPSTGLAIGNPHAMRQVLTNLLVNALDATEGVASPLIAVRTSRTGDQCVVEVADNGHGIPRENLGRVFEPFFTTKPIGQGTGLGLSICSKLMREQRGDITVTSDPGKGATFTLRLPIAKPVSEPCAAAAAAPGGIGSDSL